MTIYDLLDRPIAFHAPLVDLTGSITAALMLSQAIYWSKRTKHDGGWFYKSREEWTEETRMSRDEQETARKKLRASGFWQERYDRVNHRKWYRVNQAALLAAIMALSEPKRDSRLALEGFPLSCNRAENTTKNTLTKEDIGGAEVDFFEEIPTESKPDRRSKSAKLKSLKVPDYPSEQEFDEFIESESLASVETYRENLYSDLCDRKWHHWRPALNKWIPIRDWRSYVAALDEKIQTAND